MNKFDEKVRRIAAQELEETELPESFRSDMDHLLERLPEREAAPARRSWGMKPAFAAAFAAAAVVIFLPFINSSRSSILGNISSSGNSTEITDRADLLTSESPAAVSAVEMYESATCTDPQNIESSSYTVSDLFEITEVADTTEQNPVLHYCYDLKKQKFVTFEEIFDDPDTAASLAGVDDKPEDFYITEDLNLVLTSDHCEHTVPYSEYSQYLNEEYRTVLK